MGSPVMQFQLLAKYPEKAAEFYCNLFQWSVDSNNSLGYRALKTNSGQGIDGGIWPAPPEGHAMVQLFVQVENVAATADNAKSLGGNIVMPPQVLPDGDEMAIILDPEGIPVGLFRPAQSR